MLLTVLRHVVTGIIQLLRFNPAFVDSFQTGRRQALWSFAVMVLGLPLWLFGLFAGRIVTPGTNGFTLSASLLAAFLVSWLALPAAIFVIGRIWNRRQEALNAIYFYNFWALAIGLVFLAFRTVFVGGSSPPDLQSGSQIVLLSLLAAVTVYQTYALRTLLRIDGAWTLALVAADLGIALCIDRMLTPAVLCVPLI